MGEAIGFEKEKLVMGVLISRTSSLEALKERLQSFWGPIDMEAGPFPFEYTPYYDEEMGTPIFRWFYSFDALIPPEDLAAVKLRTNRIESEYAEEGGRRVNLDPGILSLSKFILATTKNNAHRVPLRDGIYAELTLQFRKGEFHPLEWTYPDFSSRENRDVLLRMRDLYRRQRKAGTH